MDEIELMTLRVGRIEQNVKDITTASSEHEKIVLERIQIKVEEEMIRMVQDEVKNSQTSITKTMIVVVLGCMVVLGLGKLII